MPERKTYIAVAPGGHYHDWYAAKDRTIVDAYVVLDFAAWNRWYNAARFADTDQERQDAAALLPDPVSRRDSYGEVNAERDRLNAQLQRRRDRQQVAKFRAEARA